MLLRASCLARVSRVATVRAATATSAAALPRQHAARPIAPPSSGVCLPVAPVWSSGLHTSVRLSHAADSPKLHGTTILAVRKGNDVVLIGDGQVSMGGTVFKPNARKVRVIGNGKVIVGFAGSTADCFALLDVFEKKLEEYSGQLLRAAVELAKMWRTDKFLRHLNSQLIAVDKDMSIILSGDGDVISEPMDGVIGIGSGGLFALAAARALVDRPDLNAREVAVKSMRIAADICVYTNTNFTIEAFENGELITGDRRAALDAADRANAEAADRETRRKIEYNTQQTQQIKIENK